MALDDSPWTPPDSPERRKIYKKVFKITKGPAKCLGHIAEVKYN